MFRIFQALRNREEGSSNTQVQTSLNKKFAHNIQHGLGKDLKIPLGTDISLLVRRKNYIAILDTNDQLSLYNLHCGRKLWSVLVDYLPNYNLTPNWSGDEPIAISDTGLVLYVTKNRTRLQPEQLQLYQHGKLVKQFQVDREGLETNSVRIIQDLIYALFRTNDNNGTLLIWNKEGDRLSTLSISMHLGQYYKLLGYNKAQTNVYCTDNYYCIYSGNKIFIYNIHTKVGQIIEVNNELIINQLVALDEELFIATQRIQNNPWVAQTFAACIHRINIKSGKTIWQSEPFNESAFIQKMVANDKYVVFRLLGIRSPHSICCLNLKTNKIDRLDISHLNEWDHLSIHETFLSVISIITFNHDENFGTSKWQIIDLDNRIIQQSTDYSHFGGYLPSFDSHLLVTATSGTESNALYIENFRHVDADLDDEDRVSDIRQVRI